MTSKDGLAFAAYFSVNNHFEDITIPLSSFKPDAVMLLPTPYPGFQPLMFLSSATESFNLNDIDKMQFLFEIVTSEKVFPETIELESVLLEKSK